MRLAIIGATGLVGSVVLEVLQEFNFQYDTLILAASERSVGKEIKVKRSAHKVVSIAHALEQKPNIAIFSAGSATSLEWAEKFEAQNCYVIDNSSAFRMQKDIALVVPEINADQIFAKRKIIANPNCSTIQMVVALADLHKKFQIKRLVISTYQSVSGTGKKALDQLYAERENRATEKVYAHPIDLNCFAHGGDFLEDGYTTEEVKLINETRKIFNDQSIQITATVVRIPVIGGHSEAVNIEFKNSFEIDDVIQQLEITKGVKVMNDNKNFNYPTPKLAHHKNDVLVGRIRKDPSVKNGLNLWIVADNLRKGAATNAIQIALKIQERIFA